ncbi:FlhB HrpN YscU SpaS Family [Halanaerobium congolense]|uniref:FlhB HrpN YscU SpaS Family n=1 Tax=Halanaerobium congolense TaxID=54121 RepID=A0A1G8N6N1_9FIRM|nr:EscU/YscU/HrcU family type III secretion system export apparatus switch protein [Halanaerobium congolense]SDI75746.1 FlhB HrpN YscU SpaS Family [Halanaerobium congolense]SET47748.1 FlhB HrpN YscU SpaS Family [Halanaerobium congolense]
MAADSKNNLDKEHLKKTVALKYDHTKDSAPKIIASGKGNIAEKILKKAKIE